MSLKQIKRYLDNIENNKPINLSKFFKVVDVLSLETSRASDDIKAYKHSGDLYIVTEIEAKLKQELYLLTSSNDWNRESLAKQNRSHGANVDGSFIIIRSSNNLPTLITIGGNGEVVSGFEQKQQALLIENRQNFLKINETMKFIKEYANSDLPPDLDIIFTEGNAITNALHKPFLSEYEHLSLLLDFDLGGLTIAKNLTELLPNTSMKLILPLDIEERLSKVVEVKPPDYLEKVFDLGSNYPILTVAASIIHKHKKILEQESYLNDV
jgi:hypothetical protein